MEIVSFLIDFIVHIDKHLEALVVAYGAWVYALLFLIVFVETGLVVMPFLPGDSLLFIVGAMAGVGMLHFPLACGILLAAAILGDQCNYTVGRMVGPPGLSLGKVALVQPCSLRQGQCFYERYGGVTIILARFMPFIRTFVPFAAGVAHMSRSKFSVFNVAGAVLWVLGIVSAGYFFGNLLWVREHLETIIWALILIPGAVALYGGWKTGRQTPQA
ncbi:VTT domain-containing protein [Comamonas aquatica]|uniref:VTT domain-containing protein n=1 Tax=Comamonas aquatica TaxID=225991 RepID=UPI001EF22C2B|nr:VTT domain-containing protein [Comamonas aquatica]